MVSSSVLFATVVIDSTSVGANLRYSVKRMRRIRFAIVFVVVLIS